jgi:plastocyanin domain-containing protein
LAVAKPHAMGKAPCHQNAMTNRFTIAALGLALTSQFGVLACHKDDGAPKPVVAVGDQTIAVTADERGFTPAAIETQAGSKLTLRFTRTTDATCADKVVFPEAGIEKDLPLKQPVDVMVPTDKARTLGFQCGMGMFKSSVVIR